MNCNNKNAGREFIRRHFFIHGLFKTILQYSGTSRLYRKRK